MQFLEDAKLYNKHFGNDLHEDQEFRILFI